MLACVAWQWRACGPRRLVRSPARGSCVAGAQINRVHYIVAAFGDAARFLEAGSNNPADALQSAGGTPVKVSEAVDKYKKDVLQTLHDVVRAAPRYSRTCVRTARADGSQPGMAHPCFPLMCLLCACVACGGRGLCERRSSRLLRSW